MKRISLLLIFLSLAGTTLAQRGFQVGLRATPQLTAIPNADYADSLETPATFGMAGGLAVGYGLNSQMSVMANVLYSSQGQDFTYDYIDPNDGESYEARRELRKQYIQVPVFFKYGTNMERKYAFYGQIGPQFGYLVSAEDRSNDRRYQPDTPPYMETAGFPDTYDRYNEFDLQAAIAAGLDVKLRFNLKMNVQVRASYSLLDVDNKDYTYMQRVNGVEQEVNYWEDYAGIEAASRNLNAGLTIGFTYIFIPRFHY